MNNLYVYKFDSNYSINLHSSCVKPDTNGKYKNFILRNLYNNKKIVVSAKYLQRDTMTLEYSRNNKWIIQNDDIPNTLQSFITENPPKYLMLLPGKAKHNLCGSGAFDMSIIGNSGPYTITGDPKLCKGTKNNTINISGAVVDISGLNFEDITTQLFNITDSSVSLRNITVSGGTIDNINFIKVTSNPIFTVTNPSAGRSLPTPAPAPPSNYSLSIDNINITGVSATNTIIHLKNIKSLTNPQLTIKKCSAQNSIFSFTSDISLINAHMTLIDNSIEARVFSGGVIYTQDSLMISGERTNLKFLRNHVVRKGIINVNPNVRPNKNYLTINISGGGQIDFSGNNAHLNKGAALYSNAQTNTFIGASYDFCNNTPYNIYLDNSVIIVNGPGNNVLCNKDCCDNGTNKCNSLCLPTPAPPTPPPTPAPAPTPPPTPPTPAPKWLCFNPHGPNTYMCVPHSRGTYSSEEECSNYCCCNNGKNGCKSTPCPPTPAPHCDKGSGRVNCNAGEDCISLCDKIFDNVSTRPGSSGSCTNVVGEGNCCQCQCLFYKRECTENCCQSR